MFELLNPAIYPERHIYILFVTYPIVSLSAFPLALLLDLSVELVT